MVVRLLIAQPMDTAGAVPVVPRGKGTAGFAAPKRLHRSLQRRSSGSTSPGPLLRSCAPFLPRKQTLTVSNIGTDPALALRQARAPPCILCARMPAA